MFLLFVPPGAVIPLFSLRLQELNFSPVEIGLIWATQAVGALLAPLVAGQVADRWLPAERCVSVYAFVAGILLWLLADLTTPLLVFWTSFAFWLHMGPALTLGTTLCFAHLPDPARDFGPIRLFGTIGWVVPGWLLGYWYSNPAWIEPWIGWLRGAAPQSDPGDFFRLASVSAFLISAYALTLPHTPPQPLAKAGVAPLEALRLLRDRTFAVYCVCTLGVYFTFSFTTQVTPLLLKHLGIPLPWMSPTLTISQYTEILSLALLPMILLRLGVRGTMLLGLIAWALALSVLTIGWPVWLVVSSLGLNGLCVCCFLVSGQLFVNSRARGDIRASAQGLLSFINGLGLLTGSVFVGWVRREVDQQFQPTFAVAAAIALTLLVVFFVGFTLDEGD